MDFYLKWRVLEGTTNFGGYGTDMDKYNRIQTTIWKLMEWLQLFEMGLFKEILFLEL